MPAGAYTTARTCSRARRLFEWETHVSRTAASIKAMLFEKDMIATRRDQLLAELAMPDALHARLDATVAIGVHEFLRQHGDDDELKVTVLVSWEAEEVSDADGNGDPDAAGSAWPLGSVACHVSRLSGARLPPIRVEVRGAPRANAGAKDSAWVVERAPLEELMSRSTVGPLDELLLTAEGGVVLEGSQSNFFALIDGAVHTADEGVLAGTVRRLLLEVCEREGIPIVRRPPAVADASRWEGALLSSTSRLALPVDELYVPAQGQPSVPSDLRATFNTAPGSLATRLADWVRTEVEAHSTEIPMPVEAAKEGGRCTDNGN